MTPKRTVKPSKLDALTSAVTSLQSSMTELSKSTTELAERLFGGGMDSTRKGLTAEFAEMGKGLRESVDAIGKLNARMDGIEQFKNDQSGHNKVFQDVADKIKTAENKLMGGEKVVQILWTLGSSSFGGFIVWAIMQYAGKKP
jgi:prophage DNA circulation protein